MTEIRDVIGDMRAKYLTIMEHINAIKLQLHLLEYRVSKLENPSAAGTLADSQSTLEDPDGHSIDSLPSPPAGPRPSPGVGSKPARRKSNSPRVRGGGERSDDNQ